MSSGRVLVADRSLHALLGHTISVAKESVTLGYDGLCEVSDSVAEVLLQQDGWSERPAPEVDESPRLSRKRGSHG